MNKRIGLIILLAVVCKPLQAQVDEPTDEPQQETVADEPAQQKTAPAKTADSTPPAPKSKSQPDTTVFNPTEEISEDSPVPFPVDI